jgi:multiple sugar transport system substrate-binding protein
VEDPEGTVERAIAEEFMRQNPNIRIEFMGVPMNDMYARLTTLAIGGELPCLFTNTPEFFSTAHDMGITTNLNEIFDDEYIERYYPVLVDQATYEGELQYLPWFLIPMGLLYRADWFEEAGLEAPQTWEDFLEAAQALTQDTDGDGRTDRWGFAMVGSRNASGASRFVQILRSFGAYELRQNEDGEWVTELDSEEAIEAFRFFTNLHTEHGVVPPGPTEVSYGEAVSLMASEIAGMMITGPHTIGAILAQNPELEGSIHSTPLPEGQRRVSSSGMLGFSISDTCQHKEAAAEYLRFLTNKENMLEWNAVTGRMPALIEAGEEPQISGPVYAGFVEAINYIEALPAVPFYPQIFDAMANAYQATLVGGVAPETAAMQAAEETRAAIRAAP